LKTLNISHQNINPNPYSKFKPIDNQYFLKKHASNITNKKNIATATISSAALIGVVIGIIYKNKTSYKTNLMRDLEKELGTKIKKSQLSNIIDKKEFIKLLKNLKEENFIATKENIDTGIFCADLHSHTWRSDGWGIVENILDEVAEYADNLNKKTGKKFLFSITDHDTLEGTKEAIKLIVSNPEKYKNIKFVPGIELSFIQKTDNGFEGAELLAHCINPFSENINSFIDKLHCKREKMIETTINKLKNHFGEFSFKRSDMDEFYLKKPNENFAYNLHWRVLNYAQVKNKINELAFENNLNPAVLYQELMSKWNIGKNEKSLNNFLRFLAQNGYDNTISKNNNIIEEICKENFPKIKNDKIITLSENTFDEIISLFSSDKNSVIGFAHPAFTFKSFANYQDKITELIKKSQKIIKTTEKYHQSYENPIKNGAITQKNIDDINSSIDKFNLLNLGGRDNHCAHFLNTFI